MTALKNWFPFRFNRAAKRNAESLPNKANGGSLQPGFGAPLATMRDEMDRMFERFWSNPMAPLDSTSRWFGDFSSAEFLPKLDITDDAESLKVTLETPGVEEKDIDIEVQDGVLIVSGEKKHEQTREDEGCYRTECSYGAFRRAIPLPAEVATDKAEARLDKGVLTIRLPKTEKAKKGTIQIPVKG